jgi:hypothetical protein
LTEKISIFGRVAMVFFCPKISHYDLEFIRNNGGEIS